MITILKEDLVYTLLTERLASTWWVELVHRPTGNTQIIFCKTRDQAMSLFASNTLDQVVRFYNSADIPIQKVYKANVNFHQGHGGSVTIT